MILNIIEEDNVEYSYDSNDNLIEKIEKWNSNQTFRTEYTYEEGGGNYRQIFESIEPVDYEIDWDHTYGPAPTKSQTPKRHKLNTHYPGPLNLLLNKLL